VEGALRAPNVWITAVRDVKRLENELGKYLAKGPAGKVSYSRKFPAAEPLVVVKSGPCDAWRQGAYVHVHFSE